MSNKMKIKIFFSCIMLTLLFLCACRTQSVYAKEKITVGTNAEYAPFEYLDSDGNLTGFDYELLEAIAQEENLELEWKDMPLILWLVLWKPEIFRYCSSDRTNKRKGKKCRFFGCLLYGIPEHCKQSENTFV